MSARRPTTPQMRNGLKLATKSALFSAGGPAALVRDGFVRVKEAALSFCSSPHADHVDRFVGIDTALDLDFAAGEPVHARALAAAQGFKLEPMEPPTSTDPLCVRAVARLGQETSALKICILDAVSDEVIDARERLLIEAQLSDVERELADIRAKLRGAS